MVSTSVLILPEGRVPALPDGSSALPAVFGRFVLWDGVDWWLFWLAGLGSGWKRDWFFGSNLRDGLGMKC